MFFITKLPSVDLLTQKRIFVSNTFFGKDYRYFFDTDCRVIVVLKESVERTVMMVQEVHPEHPGRLVQLVPLELKANLDEEEQMEPQEKLDLLAFLAEREELVL